MVRFKMIGRDQNSNPTQYRVWIVEDQPDFTGQFYVGLKSGSSPLLNISAYIIDDDTVADFNLPNPLQWKAARKTLPDSIAGAQLAIIDGYVDGYSDGYSDGYNDGYTTTNGYVYLFGGKISSRIHRANINNPTSWEDTLANLPTPLYGSQLAIINNYIYLFGGNDGSATDHIFSASIFSPLDWTDHGALLPNKIYDSQLVIIDGVIYLLGGRSTNDAVSTIFFSYTADPLTWFDTGASLPNTLYGSQAAIIDGYAYLFGGLQFPDVPVKNIYMAPISNLLEWSIPNYLPYPVNNGQFFTIGNKGYIATSGAVLSTPKSQGTRILRCDLLSPTQWIDTLRFIPGEISESQIAIIYDTVFIFGGNGSSVIFYTDSQIKYKLDSAASLSYGSITRTEYNSTPNKLDLFRILGFPPWKTSYGS